MDINPYQSPTAELKDPAPPRGRGRGIRKAWAVVLGWCVISYLGNLYSLLKLAGRPPLVQVFQLCLDAVIIFGLYEFVTRKPIRHLALRLLYLLLVVVLLLRSASLIYFVILGTFPWQGTAFLLLAVPLGLLTAYGLWRHATQPAQAVAPRDDDPADDDAAR